MEQKRTIKGLRCDAIMSQDDLASELEMDKSKLQRFENFKQKPDIDEAIKIADIFGVDDLRTIKWA